MCLWQHPRITATCGSCHTYEWIMSHIWMNHVTHMNESWSTLNDVCSCKMYLWQHPCITDTSVCVCVCVCCVCVCVCVYVYVYARAHARVCVCVCTTHKSQYRQKQKHTISHVQTYAMRARERKRTRARASYRQKERKRGRTLHRRGGGLGSSTIFKKFNEPYAPS